MATGRLFASARNALVALGLFAASASASAAGAACRIEQVGALPVRVSGHRVLVTATINGRPFDMIVDTGAPFTVLSRHAAEILGLHLHDTRSITGITVSGIGGDAHAMTASVDELSFGQFKLQHSSLFVAGDMDRAGIVGRDMFSDYDVEVDLAHGMIRLLRPTGCTDAQMVYWGGSSYSEAPLSPRNAELGDYETQILLNGRTFPAILDTGSPRTTVTTGAAQLAGISLTSPGSIAAGEVGGIGTRRLPSFSGLFGSVGIGDEAVKNTRIFVADLFRYNQQDETGTRLGAINDDPTYGLVGFDFFRSHRVLISNSHHKVFFSYQGGPVFFAWTPQAEKEDEAQAAAPSGPTAPPAVPPPAAPSH